MKSGIGSLKSFSLNWPYNFGSFLKSFNKPETLGRFALLNAFSKSQISIEDYIKYKNTIAFWDYVMDRKKQ